MNVILLADLHIGAKNASSVMCSYQIEFFVNNLFPYMKKNKITEIIQFGDVFDTRKFSNHYIMDIWKRQVFDYMLANDIKFTCLVGNHDSFYKNTLSVNSPNLFLSQYSNIQIIDKPKELIYDDTTFLMLPWICHDNEIDSLNLIKTTKAPIAIGHLELKEFEMSRGLLCDSGMDHKLFSKFEHVFSGHFHHKSDYNNIAYLGCPFEFTWIDYNDPKGFHVFDTKTYKTKFHKNRNSLFYKLEYDDKGKDSSYWKTIDIDNLVDKYVKLVVINKTDPAQFDLLVSALYGVGCADFKIVEDLNDFGVDIDGEELETEDSMSLVDVYIDAYEFDGDKDKLKKMMKNLYVEALSTLE